MIRILVVNMAARLSAKPSKVNFTSPHSTALPAPLLRDADISGRNLCFQHRQTANVNLSMAGDSSTIRCMRRVYLPILAIGVLTVSTVFLTADPVPPAIAVVMMPSGEVQLSSLPGFPEGTYRLELSDDLKNWYGLANVRSGAAGFTYADGGVTVAGGTNVKLQERFYRAVPQPSPTAITGDILLTDAGEIVIHPVDHASFVVQWGEMMLYNDPVGAASLYRDFPAPNMILVSHQHGDHFSASTLNGIMADGTTIIAPEDVYNRMNSTLKAKTTILQNGENVDLSGLNVEAVPSYNSRHPKGRDNGYVVTIGGKRIYMSGDTVDTVEMRALSDIDVAFLVMNIPFTMTVEQAASAVRDFKPRVVYPYHFRNQGGSFADRIRFRSEIGTETDSAIEVRLREWY
ncbi:MAG: L-ascorbate metabolism protein UlaG (beta-lactamase superfamily) [Verrucomicrobiales bacterium]|jgi:L-ascorbate metabolism protein UlaG (beta-lactamase superfamily)